VSTTLYWLLFVFTAIVLLVGVPVAAWLERRRDDRERVYLDRQARLERTEQARRLIRLRVERWTAR
jgi:membrane protein implicated in regulation of membrane protease activity